MRERWNQREFRNDPVCQTSNWISAVDLKWVVTAFSWIFFFFLNYTSLFLWPVYYWSSVVKNIDFFFSSLHINSEYLKRFQYSFSAVSKHWYQLCFLTLFSRWQRVETPQCRNGLASSHLLTVLSSHLTYLIRIGWIAFCYGLRKMASAELLPILVDKENSRSVIWKYFGFEAN